MVKVFVVVVPNGRTPPKFQVYVADEILVATTKAGLSSQTIFVKSAVLTVIAGGTTILIRKDSEISEQADGSTVPEAVSA